MEARSEGFKHIVRIAGCDLDGTWKLLPALTRIKGVSFSFANAIVRVLELDPNVRLGWLSDREIEAIKDVIANPKKYGIPSFLYNRQRDLETGEDLHLVGADLEWRQRLDIERLKRIRCWRGWRHSLGLKVRGQRTRTTGRKGRTVGVIRRKK